MAASFTLTLKCTICGHSNTITNTNETAKGSVNTKEVRYKCAYCKVPIPISFSSIALTHSGDVGANQTLTHTMATPGTIVSAASNPA